MPGKAAPAEIKLPFLIPFSMERNEIGKHVIRVQPTREKCQESGVEKSPKKVFFL